MGSIIPLSYNHTSPASHMSPATPLHPHKKCVKSVSSGTSGSPVGQIWVILHSLPYKKFQEPVMTREELQSKVIEAGQRLDHLRGYL